MALLTELRVAWAAVRDAITRDYPVGAPAITTLIDLIKVFLERRYKRYHTVLTGCVREEVLANVARQIGETHEYICAFQRDITDRCGRCDLATQAQFAGSR